VSADGVEVRTPSSLGGPGFSRAALGLVAELVRRDLALHHRHTRLGILWGIAPPLLAAGALDLFLGRFTSLPAEAGGVRYAAFLYAGLVPWQFFARAASRGAGSVVGNAWILGQAAFPRLVLPLSHALVGAVDLAVGTLVLAFVAAAAGAAFGAHLLWLPVALVALLLTSVGVSVLLGALSVGLRDVVHATPYAVQLAVLATPVLYPLESAGHGALRTALLLNPMTGVVEAFRAAWLGGTVDATAVATSLVGGAALLVGGVALFRRAERAFVDVL
jgi:lipopolysaccharide transport system permease protein